MKSKKRLTHMPYPAIVFLLLAAACLTFLIPKPVHAAINREKISGGIRLYGTETVSMFDDQVEKIIGFTDYDTKDYTISLSVTFPSVNDTPDYIKYDIDSNYFTLYNEGSTVFRDSRTITELDISPETKLHIEFGYELDYYDECDAIIDFSIKEVVKVKPTPTPAPKPQAPKVILHGQTISPLYPGDNDTLQLDINDPSLEYSSDINHDLISVKFSDPSVAALTKKDFFGNFLTIQFHAFKGGTTQCIVTYKGVTATQTIRVNNSTFFVPSSVTMTQKQKKHISAYIQQMGTGTISVSKLKSSNRKVVAISGKRLIAKKTGSAKITFTVNGVRKSIRVRVTKPIPKPSQIKVRLSGYIYKPDSGKTYYYLTIRNRSQRTITKIKMKYSMTLNERITRTLTHKVNVKPGTTKRVRVNIGKLIVHPDNRTAKLLNFWYK